MLLQNIIERTSSILSIIVIQNKILWKYTSQTQSPLSQMNKKLTTFEHTLYV